MRQRTFEEIHPYIIVYKDGTMNRFSNRKCAEEVREWRKKEVREIHYPDPVDVMRTALYE